MTPYYALALQTRCRAVNALSVAEASYAHFWCMS